MLDVSCVVCFKECITYQGCLAANSLPRFRCSDHNRSYIGISADFQQLYCMHDTVLALIFDIPHKKCNSNVEQRGQVDEVSILLWY